MSDCVSNPNELGSGAQRKTPRPAWDINLLYDNKQAPVEYPDKLFFFLFCQTETGAAIIPVTYGLAIYDCTVNYF